MITARSQPDDVSPPAEESSLALLRQVLDENVPGTSLHADIGKLIELWLQSEQASDLARLPELACQAAGGDARQAVPVTAAWQLVRLAAKLLDDVEDGDVTSQRAATVNIATGLLFIAHLVLDRVLVPADRKKRVGDALQLAMLRAVAGQHADLCAQTVIPTALDPDGWLAIARAKSGELVGWAAWAGACVAMVPEPALDAYREYGAHLGVLLQVADDFNGVWRPNGASDLATGHASLPVCYARSVTQGPPREQLEQALRAATLGNQGAIGVAQRLLTDLGAPNYIRFVARTQCAQACQALDSVTKASPARDRLIALANQMVRVRDEQIGNGPVEQVYDEAPAG